MVGDIMATLPRFDPALLQAKASRFLAAHLPLIRTKAQSVLRIIAGTTASKLGQIRQTLYDTTDGDASRNPTAAKKFKELTDAYAIICEELLECDVGEVTEDIIDAASGRGAEEADGPKAGLPGFGKTGR